jgi:hypothetical protein
MKLKPLHLSVISLFLLPLNAVSSDWSYPEVTDDGEVVITGTAEMRGTGSFLSYACSLISDWCGPALMVNRPCDAGVITPALFTVTGGGLDPVDEGTFYGTLTCIMSSPDSSLLRIEDQDSRVALNLFLGLNFSIAYPTEGHGYSAERFSLAGSIEAMNAVIAMAEKMNPNRATTRGDF